MKSIFTGIIITLACTVLACCQGRTVHVGYDPDIQDYTPVVSDILSGFPEGNVRLVFDRATYPFYPEKAHRKYLRISNNDNGFKKICFDICGMENVSIEGDSTSFLFHGGMVPFLIGGSAHVSLKNISIGYDKPFVLEAEVVSSDPQNRTFDIRIHEDNDYEVSGGILNFKGYDWVSGLGENICFNPETRSPYYSTERYETAADRPLEALELGDRTVRLSGTTAKELPPVGSVFVDKGPYTHNRLYPGIVIRHSKDILVEGVTVHESGAMALVAENSSDIVCRKFMTAVRPGSGRMIAASADATHFVNCDGKVILEDCIFESMLDDGTNIHGVYMKVDEILSPSSFKASFGHVQQEGFDFAGKKDKIALVDRENLKTVATGTVTDIAVLDDNCYTVSTDIDMSLYSGRKLAVENISCCPDVTVRNCTVRFNRARSLLLSSPGKILVEDCYFASMMAGIRICGDANWWFESGRTSDVVIRNNVFRDLGNGGWSPQAVLQIDPVIPQEGRDMENCYHRKITFEGNTVYSSEDQLIYALSTDSLSVRGNRFIYSGTYPVRYPGLSVIDLQFCNHVEILDNDFSLWKKDAGISIISCNDVRNNAPVSVTENPNTYFYRN